jgi:hypothetical protein
MLNRLSSLATVVLGGSPVDPVVSAYALRSGMEAGKVRQLNDLVLYLKQQGFWANVKHLYVMVKGFNAGSGATIYDLVNPAAGGENLTQTDCTWPTEEGQALTVTAAGAIASTNKLIPLTGSNTVLTGLAFLRFVATTGNRLWRQGATHVYGLAANYNATRTAEDFFMSVNGVNYNLNTSYRLGGDNTITLNYYKPFFNQAYWKPMPVAVVYNAAAGKIFAYGNYDSCSMLASADGANDGRSVTYAIDDEAFMIQLNPDRTVFDLSYLLVMDRAISGEQYQSISYEIEKAIAPRNPAKVNSGLLWLDTAGNRLAALDSALFYDSVTDKYYRYGEFGSLYTGTPPITDAPNGIYQGVYCYSSDNLNGPWKLEGLALSTAEPTLVAGCGEASALSVVTSRPSVVYHATREKYILYCKGIGKTSGDRIAVLAESDYPWGPFSVNYAASPSGNAGDGCIFKDDDGTAYIVFDNATDLIIVPLNENYTAPSGTPQVITTTSHMEAPGMVKIGSRYWLLCSETLNWDPTVHEAFYSDAANPLSGWTSAGNPFDSGDEDYEQSFWSQCAAGLVKTRNGSILYNGVRNIPMHYAPFDLRNAAMRIVLLPVAIAGDTMTISWDPHWDPTGYE